MKLGQLLSLETIEDNLKSRDRRGVLEELGALILKGIQVHEETDLTTVLEKREELGSTGIGNGVAIPHVRLKGLPHLRMAVGRSVEGVEFNAIDGQPAHIFFLLVAPENSTGEHLKVLSKISRLVKKPEVRLALLEAEGREEILKIIVAENEQE